MNFKNLLRFSLLLPLYPSDAMQAYLSPLSQPQMFFSGRSNFSCSPWSSALKGHRTSLNPLQFYGNLHVKVGQKWLGGLAFDVKPQNYFFSNPTLLFLKCRFFAMSFLSNYAFSKPLNEHLNVIVMSFRNFRVKKVKNSLNLWVNLKSKEELAEYDRCLEPKGVALVAHSAYNFGNCYFKLGLGYTMKAQPQSLSWENVDLSLGLHSSEIFWVFGQGGRDVEWDDAGVFLERFAVLEQQKSAQLKALTEKTLAEKSELILKKDQDLLEKKKALEEANKALLEFSSIKAEHLISKTDQAKLIDDLRRKLREKEERLYAVENIHSIAEAQYQAKINQLRREVSWLRDRLENEGSEDERVPSEEEMTASELRNQLKDQSEFFKEEVASLKRLHEASLQFAYMYARHQNFDLLQELEKNRAFILRLKLKFLDQSLCDPKKALRVLTELEEISSCILVERDPMELNENPEALILIRNYKPHLEMLSEKLRKANKSQFEMRLQCQKFFHHFVCFMDKVSKDYAQLAEFKEIFRFAHGDCLEKTQAFIVSNRKVIQNYHDYFFHLKPIKKKNEKSKMLQLKDDKKGLTSEIWKI